LDTVVQGLGATSIPYVRGLLTLKSGFMFSAMFLSAIAVFLIEKQFFKAALWSVFASAFSMAGLMHSYSLTPAAVREEIRPGFAWQAAAGYLALAAIFAYFGFLRRREQPIASSSHR
jgi:AGZA family xanthine/uracil permease-like MFS transporter